MEEVKITGCILPIPIRRRGEVAEEKEQEEEVEEVVEEVKITGCTSHTNTEEEEVAEEEVAEE